MSKTPNITIADIEGEWQESGFESGLIARCRAAWHKPIEDLSNEEMATLLRQKIAVEHILPLARQRVADGIDDDTEMFDGELREVIERLKQGI